MFDTENTKKQQRQSPPPVQAADLAATVESEQRTKDKATSSTSVTSPSIMAENTNHGTA